MDDDSGGLEHTPEKIDRRGRVPKSENRGLKTRETNNEISERDLTGGRAAIRPVKILYVGSLVIAISIVSTLLCTFDERIN